jgi:hypothetical protein
MTTGPSEQSALLLKRGSIITIPVVYEYRVALAEAVACWLYFSLAAML